MGFFQLIKENNNLSHEKSKDYAKFSYSKGLAARPMLYVYG